MTGDKNKQNYEINYKVSIDNRFGLIFFDSSMIDLNFSFSYCNLELGNILYHFGKLNCKTVTVWVDNLRYKYKIPTQEMINEFQVSMLPDQINPISPFINVVRVHESTHENLYILKDMKYNPTIPDTKY